VYFAFAHACLATALLLLTAHPSLPAGFFLHPRMAALVHLVTLGWITGSIFGAFYFVGPMTMRMPLRPGWLDRGVQACFAVGVSLAVTQFWNGDYTRMAWSSTLVLLPALHISLRAAAGVPAALGGWPVKLHVALAFFNLLAAMSFGIVVGLNRSYGWFTWSPVAAAYAHLHLAVVGWAVMMFVGLAYRLIPMIVPTVMPKGSSIAVSAILIELGLAILVGSLLRETAGTSAGALFIVGGLVSFVAHIRLALRQKLPPPAALPRPDWATWQTHAALLWLLVASVLGLVLSVAGSAPHVTLAWWYGVSGLIGFLTQVIAGMQGRLVPMYAWYGAFEAGGRKPPPFAAHAMGSQPLARWIFITWTLGVPSLAAGLAMQSGGVTIAASVMMLGAVLLNAAQLTWIFRRSRRGT
jgi:hypothetical protein